VVDSEGIQYPDCLGPLTSRGYNLIKNALGCPIFGDLTGNLIGSDPLLGPLQNNGGPTQTHLPRPAVVSCSSVSLRCVITQAASPVIDAGNPAPVGSGGAACPATDQRGFLRPTDGNGDGVARCDIGAVETVAVSTSLGTFRLTPEVATVAVGERLTYRFSWTVPEGTGWRSLDSLELLLRDDEGTALWLRFHEVTGEPGTFGLVDPSDGTFKHVFAPGDPNRLETNAATVYLAQSTVEGPPGRTVTLTIDLSLKPRARRDAASRCWCWLSTTREPSRVPGSPALSPWRPAEVTSLNFVGCSTRRSAGLGR